MKMSILVVDDSIINLSAVEQKLKDRYDVATANSGDKALRYLKNEKPDLILLDIKMDNMDGIETLKQIREMENGTDIPVIMLTARGDKRSIVETQRLGICDYVLKPFDPQELRLRIEKALRNQANS
ncbi:MAG: response regulator [Lachnospiraceae bacterium]|uniref:response regulator n=1 Tax=Roseburia sp. 1XD42-69 TaxID=2320088 RepID=UPI000EA0A4F8|nr:response regulator [Roseburia sp. 1XD42-69]MCI8874934.1 response regulator [Lachnospiraceae bacterium]MCX4319112.1 response regulator [Lachnospiraceae bacterium]RKJ63458.1 response regulator [Roseburia sp. 1XD42-69]